MAEGKKYYWLKLKRDFFKRHDIKIIEGMENGKDYILFYLKLLVESVDHNGNLRFSDTIPYNDKMLATVTYTKIDIVKKAMCVLQDVGLVELKEDGTIFVRKVRANTRNRSSTEYKNWRTAVFQRDQYTCQVCGNSKIKLNAHHIKKWSQYPRERYKVSNGITMCEKCHKEYHKKYGR